jgi:hypothetical protein
MVTTKKNAAIVSGRIFFAGRGMVIPVQSSGVVLRSTAFWDTSSLSLFGISSANQPRLSSRNYDITGRNRPVSWHNPAAKSRDAEVGDQ